MIGTIIYIICLIVIATLYCVGYKSAKNNFKADLDYMQRVYESRRESWIKEIKALKEDNDSLKVDNTVLQADYTSLKETNEHLDTELSFVAGKKTEAEIKVTQLEKKLADEKAWWCCALRIPQSDDRALVCSVTRSGEKRINIAYYKDGKWHGTGNLDNVIAWKGLPEMPEFEGDDPLAQCKTQNAKCKIEEGVG